MNRKNYDICLKVSKYNMEEMIEVLEEEKRYHRLMGSILDRGRMQSQKEYDDNIDHLTNIISTKENKLFAMLYFSRREALDLILIFSNALRYSPFYSDSWKVQGLTKLLNKKIKEYDNLNLR